MTPIQREHRRQDLAVLGTVFSSSQLGEVLTVREFLIRALLGYWEGDEDLLFERGAWREDIAAEFIDAGLLEGEFCTPEKDVMLYSDADLDELMNNAIKALGATEDK